MTGTWNRSGPPKTAPKLIHCNNLLTNIILFSLLLRVPPSISSPSPSFSESSIINQAWPLTQWAREAIQKADIKFKNIHPIVIDPNSNKDTNNQKSIYIASEFLNHAASSTFMNDDKLSEDEDRLVKVGRSLVDLVDSVESEEVLKMGLENLVQQCNILAMDDLKVGYYVIIVSLLFSFNLLFLVQPDIIFELLMSPTSGTKSKIW